MNKKQALRITLSLIGVLLIGFSISLSRVANLGTDPFTTFNLGLSSFFDIQFGTYMVISNAIGLIFVFLLARHLIGIGTFFNIFLVGYVADFGVGVITSQFGEISLLWLRIFLVVLSLVILAAGAAMYIVAARGIAPFDAIPIIVEERTNGKVSFQTARVVTDILAIGIGLAFGATLGVNTLVSGFFMGPLIQFFRTKFSTLLEDLESPKTEMENNCI